MLNCTDLECILHHHHYYAHLHHLKHGTHVDEGSPATFRYFDPDRQIIFSVHQPAGSNCLPQNPMPMPAVSNADKVVVSNVIVENNIKIRESLGCRLDKSPTTTDTSSEESADEITVDEEPRHKCCKYCFAQYYIESKPNTQKPYSTPTQIKSFVIATSTPGEEDEFMLTPPLRKITARELNAVKLRKSEGFLGKPKTPEINDLLAVLRKRFAVMHSFASDNDADNNDSDGDSCSFLVSSADCIQIACS